MIMPTGQTELDKQDRPAVDFLIGYLTAQRLPAEAGLGESIAKYPRKLDKRTSSVVGSIKSPEDEKTLGDLARQSLSSQLRKLDGAVSGEQQGGAGMMEAAKGMLGGKKQS